MSVHVLEVTQDKWHEPFQWLELMNGAEAMVKMLEAHGVEYIFGLCGDTSLPFYDALYQLKTPIKHILTRDERSAAYMADGYARVTGKPGICEGPSGGGATYILPGLIEANDSSIPILAFNSDVGVSSRGKYPLTELDQEKLFSAVTDWNSTLLQAPQIPNLVRSAFRNMVCGKPGATHLCFPIDTQKEEGVEASQIWAEKDLTTYPTRRFSADEGQIEAAATLINLSQNPLILCGGGPVISGAFTETQLLAETIGAPVATSVSGHGILSDMHPLALGVVGSNGGVQQTRNVVEAADLVIFIGCRAGSVTTERWRSPQNRQTKIVHLDIDSAVIGANYETDVALLGDAKLTLKKLIPLLQNCSAEKIAESETKVAQAKETKFGIFQQLAQPIGKEIKPEMVVAALQNLLDEDALIVADPGTPCPYFSAYYQFKKAGRYFITNRAHGALGYSLPAAMGSHFGRPQSQCIAVMGDGSFGFNAGELETVVRYNLPITFIVISNSVFGWIKAGQKAQFGERYFSVDFSRTDHAKVAEAFGVRAFQVKKPQELESKLKHALTYNGPSLVDIHCQPLQEANAPVSEWIA